MILLRQNLGQKTNDKKLLFQTILFTILWIAAAAALCYLIKL